MRLLRQLTVACEQGDAVAIANALVEARNWLNNSNSFEYQGPVKLKFQGDLIMEYLQIDLSDVIKKITGKGPGDSLDAELYLILPAAKLITQTIPPTPVVIDPSVESAGIPLPTCIALM